MHSRLHLTNTAQVLEVEEVQRGRGLRVAGGADDRLRRQMHQIGDTLQVDGKRATLQDAEAEKAAKSELTETSTAAGLRHHLEPEGESGKERKEITIGPCLTHANQ